MSCGSDTYYLVPAANRRKTIVKYHETIQETITQKDHLKLCPWDKTKFLLILRNVTFMLIWILLYYDIRLIFAVSTTLYCVLDVESAGSRVGRNVITSHIMLGPGPAWTLDLETSLCKVFTIKETASTTYWDLLLHPGQKCLLALSHLRHY